MRTACVGVTTVCGLLVAAACGGGGGGTQPGPTAKTIALNGGDTQVGAAGTALATPLSVIVKDSTGAGVQGIAVNWAAASGGGSVSAASSVTDAGGVAAVIRTLGATAGAHTTTATKAGLVGSPVTFNAVAQIQGATQMALNAGNSQTDTVLATLAPLSVLVRDQNNTPVSGVVVNWTAMGGSVSAPTSTSNGSGIASIGYTLGATAGTQSAQAALTGLSGSPVSFNATATAGNAFTIVKTSGDGGTVAPNAMVTYTVTARDNHSNPKAGVTIDWDTAGGGGTISPAQNTTAANGQASATRTLSATTGPHLATATANGIPGTPSVTFTTTAASVASVTVGSGGNNFNPQNLTVANGTTVTWTFSTGIHAITWLTGPATPPNTVNPMPATSTYQFTFTVAGPYTYECPNHPGMTGSVTVN